MSVFVIALVFCYMLGSIPTAIIVGRVVGGVDIREHGSGNAGATNVYRMFGLGPYMVTLTADIFKGYAAVVFISPMGAAYLSDQRTAVYCGAAAVVGHIWTLFAGFKGGKGVATAGGVMLGLMPYAALAAVGVYLLVTMTTKYVSLGSMTAAISVPLVMLAGRDVYEPELWIVTIALSALIIFTHRKNISQLLKGEEKKTDFLAKLKRPR